MRCAGTRPSSIQAAARRVSAVCVSYSGTSWTASSGSRVASAVPGGLQRSTATAALSGRLRTSSRRVAALLRLGGDAPEDAGLPGGGAAGDVAEAIGGGLHSAGVAPVRLVGGAVALDHLRAALQLALELRLDLVGRGRGLAAARDHARRGDRGHEQREASPASHGRAYTPPGARPAFSARAPPESRRRCPYPRAHGSLARARSQAPAAAVQERVGRPGGDPRGNGYGTGDPGSPGWAGWGGGS